MAAIIARAPIRFVATWFATVVGASACATDNVCIGDPPPTILLTAVDRFSGRDVTDSASGFARLGERRSELTAFAFGSDGRVLAIGAYLPVPGPYQVVVARRGYKLFDTIGVRVSSGECFTRGPSLVARLTPVSP